MKNKIIYVAFGIVSIIYNLVPVDAIPDVIPLVGAIDDVIAILIPLIMGFNSISRNS